MIESCGYEDVLGESHIVSSRGVEVSSQAAYCGIYTALLAEEEGRQETGFAMNFLQAIALQRIGFWGSLFIRLGHYLIWHIANGIMIELALQANGN